MSLILDALKKSEVERQRQAIPGLMDSHPPPPRTKFPLWAVALIALLAINLGVIALVLTRGGTHAIGAAGSDEGSFVLRKGDGADAAGGGVTLAGAVGSEVTMGTVTVSIVRPSRRTMRPTKR